MIRRVKGVMLGSGWLVTMIIAAISAGMFGCEQEFVKGGREFHIETLREDAVRVVREGLKDENPMVRAKAAEVVAAADIDVLKDEVVKLIGDDYVPVRFAAAVACGDMKYKAANTYLNKMIEVAKDENTRIAAEYGMYMMGDKKRLEFVTDAVKSKKMDIRANAVFLMGKSGDETYLNIVKWAQQDMNSDDKVKLAAMEARTRLGDKQVMRRLWALMFSAYADDRILAAMAMGLLGTNKARDVLFTRLDDEVIEVRLAVAATIGAMGDFAGRDDVVEVLRKDVAEAMSDDASERLKVLAAMAIGGVCADDLEHNLSELLRDDSKIVRMAAAKAVLECSGK